MPATHSTRDRLQQRHEKTEGVRGSLTKSFDEADADGDGSITFEEYGVLCQGTRADFDQLDHDRNGTVDKAEYLQVTLLKALTESYTRAADLIKAMDRDNNRKVDKPEFRSFIKRLGFDAQAATADAIFEAMDEDGSGELSHKELENALKPAEAEKLTPKLGARSRKKKKKKKAADQQQHVIDVGDSPAGPDTPLLDDAGDKKRAAAKGSLVCAKLGFSPPPPPYGQVLDVFAFLVAARMLLALVRGR